MFDKKRNSSKRLAITFAGILCVFVSNVRSAADGVSYNYEGNEWGGVCATVSANYFIISDWLLMFSNIYCMFYREKDRAPSIFHPIWFPSFQMKRKIQVTIAGMTIEDSCQLHQALWIWQLRPLQSLPLLVLRAQLVKLVLKQACAVHSKTEHQEILLRHPSTLTCVFPPTYLVKLII